MNKKRRKGEEKGILGIRVELTEKQKRIFKEENKEDIAQYIRDMERWRNSPSSNGNRRLI